MSVQIEDTVERLVEKLAAEMPSRLDAIAAEAADGILLEHPTAYSLGSTPEMRFPHVAVLPTGTENTTDSGGRLHFNHLVAVACWCSDPDPEALCRKLVRYQRAAREVALRGRRPSQAEFGGGGYGLQHREDEYGEPFAAEEIAPGVLIAHATSLFAVQQQQDLY